MLCAATAPSHKLLESSIGLGTKEKFKNKIIPNVLEQIKVVVLLAIC